MRPLRIAVRKFDPFEAAIRRQFEDFARTASDAPSLEIEALELNELHARLLVQPSLRDGSIDLAFLCTDWLAEAHAAGAIENLRPYQASAPISDFPHAWSPSLVSLQDFAGGFWGMPYHDGPQCLIYRKDLLETAGLEVPKTWEDFHAVARALHDPARGLSGTVLALFPDGHNGFYDFCIPGEVLGIAGFLGAGRSELLHAIFGADRNARGEVRVHGRRVERSAVAAVRAGIALVPEDRTAQALVPGMALWQNMTLAHLGRFSRWGVIPRTRAEQSAAAAAVRRLHIKTPDVHALPGDLSGGNAQKLSVARWLCGPVRLLLLDEPTAGIDIGAKAEILDQVRALAAEGVAVILVDSELKLLLEEADRILVMRQGAIVAERVATETDEQELIRLAAGIGGRRSEPEDRPQVR